MKKFCLVLVLALACLSPVLSESLDDGFYNVIRKERPSDDVTLLKEHQARVHYNPIFLDGDEQELSVIVEDDTFVPIVLKQTPEKTQDTTDRTQFWLQISLADGAASKLETFTRENLGGTVAIVVGGKVVTMHKIKSVVTGGKLQISRCGDNGCQVLFRELTDNIEEK